jgi:hypothetical protein
MKVKVSMWFIVAAIVAVLAGRSRSDQGRDRGLALAAL